MGNLIEHWDGGAWSGVSAGEASHLASVWASTTTRDVWAVGSEGMLLHWYR
ncbi:MAG: hypothetical protein QM765_45680 [Myxococcales bacterium]